MTRDEAIQRLTWCSAYNSLSGSMNFVDNLVALGLLKLDTVEDEIRQAAARKIAGSHIVLRCGSSNVSGYLDPNSAAELIKVLTETGFKITR